jgi:hypothetical protein
LVTSIDDFIPLCRLNYTTLSNSKKSELHLFFTPIVLMIISLPFIYISKHIEDHS